MLERLPFNRLPLTSAAMRRAYQAALRRVLGSGKLILGHEVAEFEHAFARFCGARECVGLANGTDALQIALRLSGVAPGSGAEVVTTPLTASFTAHAIVAAGGKPVFADIDPNTLLIHPGRVEEAMSSTTVAVLPVHLYGQACDLNELRRIARRNKVALIQDAAQAHGTTYRGRPLADFTEFSCYSFYPTKNLGALGDGGALITNSRSAANRARLFRDGGRFGSHVARVEAINSRLDALQAAFLRLHLAQLKQWNARRARSAALYDATLAQAGIDEVRPVARAPHSVSWFHLYVIRVAGRNGRRSLMKHLASRGIETGIHYEHPLHLQPAFQRFGYQRGDFQQAEKACAEILSLPMHPFLSEAEVRRVVRAIGEHYGK